MELKSVLVIQTAFIGDVILATAVLEKLHQVYPQAKIDLLLRKGNESLFEGHPWLNKVIIWDKKKSKLFNLVKICKQVQANRYDAVINLHRHTSSGLFTATSGAKITSGFAINPFSLFFSHRYPHVIQQGTHETDRNQLLISNWTGTMPAMPRLYPTGQDDETVQKYKHSPYICLAPGSVWASKQLPLAQWGSWLSSLPKDLYVYLIGAPTDQLACEQLIGIRPLNAVNLAGKLSLLQSASLIRDAMLTYANDSAPLHLASAMNAPVAAVFCSTSTDFGFGPLSTKKFVIESHEKLPCRPCGLAGKPECPLGHFKCGTTIQNEQLLHPLNSLNH
jgi:ADP-heptose:LPS heptosyltransferase